MNSEYILLSCDARATAIAAREAHFEHGTVARRESDKLVVVVKQLYPNRFPTVVRYGYARFARKPVWVGTETLLPGVIVRTITAADNWPEYLGMTVTEATTRDMVKKALAAADEVSALRA